MNKQTPFEMLLNCGIKLALARLDAERAGSKVDRNRVVYQYFSAKRLMPPKDSKRMINIITRDIKYAAYAFDQYFQLYLGFRPGPDSHAVGEKIQEDLFTQFGVSLPEELQYVDAAAV
jgi:hypothetical protein